MLSKGDLNQHSQKCLRNKTKSRLSGSKMSKCKIKERKEKKRKKAKEKKIQNEKIIKPKGAAAFTVRTKKTLYL
jgi:hypothetical protein